MEFDDLQKAWQSQAPARVTIDTAILLKEVRRNASSFRSTIFWRDVREVGVAFLLVVYFCWRHRDWTDYLSAVACLGIGTFMVVDRVLQRKKMPVFNDALKHCLEVSLAQVNHQIWLLRNVFWWYLLPLLVAAVISMSYSGWHSHHFGRGAIVGENIAALLVGAICWWVYRLNQGAVRKSLIPRREELEALLRSLG